MVDLEKLEDIQENLARQIVLSQLDASKVKRVAGFDVVYFEDQAVCAAVVFDAQTNEVVEKKYIATRAPMPYIPGFLAFREGPLIIQAYYDLEHEPDLLMIDGHGIAHAKKCGLATFVGLELHKPTIGVGKNLLIGDMQDDKIFVDDELRGVAVKTRDFARPVFVSPGNLIDVETAAVIAKKWVFPPHKLPEPLHAAHKFAKKTALKISGGLQINEGEEIEAVSEEERLEKEFGVNTGSVV
ncbi:endonuclease V [Candidatus Woesearchaeota archaeon]|nr:endonuclease V [Candidatus Woesearchaeota archaeon]